MITHEFSTLIGSDGKPVIPVPVKNMPAGSPVRVIVLADERDFPLLSVSQREKETDALYSLEEVIREIKSSPQNPENICPASGLLAEHLGIPDEEPGPYFDPDEWNQEWDSLEAKMKTEELVGQTYEGELP